MPKSTTIDAEIVSAPTTSMVPSLHNTYHRCAQASAAQATAYAILCGLELQKIRAQVASKGGRPKNSPTQVGEFSGGWEKWVADNCEFGITTATKYIAVADGVKARLSEELLPLVNFAPSALADSERETLLQSVSHLTDGASLNDLYKDFGLTKRDPRENLRKGGATHHNGRPPSKNVDADIAHDSAVEFLSLMAKWLMQGQHQLIEINDLKHLDDQLLSAREIIKPFLKSKY